MAGKKEKPLANCAQCNLEMKDRLCLNENGKAFKGCPTALAGEVLTEANRAYEDHAVREFARQASIQESECYANRGVEPYIMQPTKTRIQEICEFGHKMGYKRFGIAFCIGLAKEAATVHRIFETHGFQVTSACCKAGRTPKESIGLLESQKIRPGNPEYLCNPVFQAEVLNEAGADLNILLGLCVGHDSLFIKYAEAPVTVLAVKDRVTGHNPLAAVYQADKYYQKLLHPEVL